MLNYKKEDILKEIMCVCVRACARIHTYTDFPFLKFSKMFLW